MPDLPPPPEPAPSAFERVSAALSSRPPQAFLAVAGLAGAALAVAVFAGSFRATPPPEISLPRAVADDRAAPEAAPEELVVHVAGAVFHPGVYRLLSPARVAEVIDEAGGPTPDADVHQLNLAAPVRDGDRIYVPRAGETAPAAGPATPGGSPSTVDLNRASEAELESLPGIGPATAKAIIAYRDEHGPFRSVEELLEVRGIGPAKLDALRDLVHT